MANYSSQIFYLCKNDITQHVNPKLLINCKDLQSVIHNPSITKEQDIAQNLKFIELFKVEENPCFFEEDFSYKLGLKRNHQSIVKLEASTSNDTHDKYEATTFYQDGKPQSFKFVRLHTPQDGQAAEVENSVASLFNPILNEIREFMDSMNKAEQFDEEEQV